MQNLDKACGSSQHHSSPYQGAKRVGKVELLQVCEVLHAFWQQRMQTASVWDRHLAVVRRLRDVVFKGETPPPYPQQIRGCQDLLRVNFYIRTLRKLDVRCTRGGRHRTPVTTAALSGRRARENLPTGTRIIGTGKHTSTNQQSPCMNVGVFCALACIRTSYIKPAQSNPELLSFLTCSAAWMSCSTWACSILYVWQSEYRAFEKRAHAP